MLKFLNKFNSASVALASLLSESSEMHCISMLSEEILPEQLKDNSGKLLSVHSELLLKAQNVSTWKVSIFSYALIDALNIG